MSRRELKPDPHLARVLYPVLKSEKDGQQPSLPAVKEASLYRNICNYCTFKFWILHEPGIAEFCVPQQMALNVHLCHMQSTVLLEGHPWGERRENYSGKLVV